MYNKDSKDEIKVRQKRGLFMVLPLILTNACVKVVVPAPSPPSPGKNNKIHNY